MSIREVMDFSNYDKIFRGGKMAKKKTGRAKEVENEINTLKEKVWTLFVNRGYNTKSEVIKMLILDIVELIMDCENKAEDRVVDMFKEWIAKL